MRRHFTHNEKKLMDAVMYFKAGQGDNADFSYTDDFLIAQFKSGGNSKEIPGEHFHDDYEFFIPFDYIPNISTDDYNLLGDIRTVYCFLPGQRHTIRFDPHDCSYCSVAVNKAFFDSIYKSSPGKTAPLSPCFKSSEKLMIMIKYFTEEFRKDEAADIKNILEPLKTVICAEIINLSRSAPEDTFVKAVKKKGMKPVCDYIHSNFSRDISVSELSEMCGMTQSYFCVCFKNAFGESPKSYINRLRIEKAQILLRSTDKNITEIASLCGFNRFNTFSLAFRQFGNGLTPGEYRKMNMK